MSNWKRENKSLGSQPAGYFWNLVGRQWLLNWRSSNREVNKGRKHKKLRRFKSCLNWYGEGGRFIGSLNWLAVTLTEMENWRAIIVIGMGVDKEKKLSSGNADFSTFSFLNLELEDNKGLKVFFVCLFVCFFFPIGNHPCMGSN